MNKSSFQPQNKSDIRKKVISKLSQMSLAERSIAAEKINRLFQSHFLFQQSQTIACYLAQAIELDCDLIIQSIIQAQKTCLLPILPTTSKELTFGIYHMGDELALNRFQILEPVHAKIFSALQLDLVLMPLVGFDQQGNRLGKGGGYYDKTFSFKINNPNKKPFLLGIAYEQQEISHLTPDSWDVKLDGILTEKRLIIFNKNNLALSL